MGGIARLIPKTYVCMLIGSFALAGIPFFSGFYSKDAILEAIYNTSHPFTYFIALVVVLLTSFYSWRLLCLTFHGKPQADEHVMAHIHESNLLILIPLGLLSVGAIFSGSIGNTYFMEQIGFNWQNSLFVSTKNYHSPPLLIHYLPTLFSIIGILTAVYFYVKKTAYIEKITFKPFYLISFNKWWIDEIYNKYIIIPVIRIADYLWKNIDQNLIDRLGPNKIAHICITFSQKYELSQTGYIYHYALSMSIGLILLSILFLIYFL
jgi:NADH-quinone oxidoreductase subunit L